MDFSFGYTKEQEEFADEVRAWLDENVPKDLAFLWDPFKLSYEQWQQRRELGRKLGEKGWLFPGYPREYGGGGLSADYSSVLHHEADERGLGLPPYYTTSGLAIGAILRYGTEEQKKRFLTSILKDGAVCWQLFTEPEAGTDEANQQTNALRHHREGEYFIVNGSKIFVGSLHPPIPDHLWLLTRSDLEAPRHQNLAMFLCPGDLPGITFQRLDLFGGSGGVGGRTPISTPAAKNAAFLDDVRIHESYLVGGEREGWGVTTATLLVEHGDGSATGAETSAVVEENILLEKFLEQCRSNPNIVKRLRENPQLLDTVVDIYVGAQIQRLLSMRNSWLPGSGRRVPYAGPQLTLYSKMLGAKLTANVARVLGPYVLTDDAEWGLEEGIFEVAQRGGVILAPGGTPEAQKIVISRALGIGR